MNQSLSPILFLRTHPQLARAAAQWFSEKWSIPPEAYLESMEACIQRRGPVPQWYVILDSRGELAAGAGVIQHDFHSRKDLAPNLCALFVEPPYRRMGVARALLDSARRDMGQFGLDRLYLVTDHESFYEKCGWRLYTMAEDENGCPIRLYTAPTL